MTVLARLIQHCNWANRVWVQFIEDSCPNDEYLLEMMTHIFLGQQAWFDRIDNTEVDPDVWEQKSLAELKGIAESHEEKYSSLLEQDLDRIVEYRRFNGDLYRSPVSDILLHLCLHGTHHRGQMATHASRNKMNITNTDFINFCRVNGL